MAKSVTKRASHKQLLEAKAAHLLYVEKIGATPTTAEQGQTPEQLQALQNAETAYITALLALKATCRALSALVRADLCESKRWSAARCFTLARPDERLHDIRTNDPPRMARFDAVDPVTLLGSTLSNLAFYPGRPCRPAGRHCRPAGRQGLPG